MGDQAARAAARHSPGSLEELAWGLRTGELRPRDTSKLRPWFPSRAQFWCAARVADLMANSGHLGVEHGRAWLVLHAWLRGNRRWSVALGAELAPGEEAVAYCVPWRPRRHGVPLERVAERLLRWSAEILSVGPTEIRLLPARTRYHGPRPTALDGLREALDGAGA